MADNYYLTQAYKNRLDKMLGDGGGADYGFPSGSSARQVTFVKVTGPAVSGYYPCVPTSFNSVTFAWDEFADSICQGPNGETLNTNKRYAVIAAGIRESDSKAIYITTSLASNTISEPVECAKAMFLDPDSDCLYMTVSSGTSLCSPIDTTQAIELVADGTGAWTGETYFKTPDTVHYLEGCGCALVPCTWDFHYSYFHTGDDACNAYFGDWTLGYTSGCTWVGIKGGHTATLTLIAGVFELSLDDIGITYTLGSIDCTGNNVLTIDETGSCEVAPPATVTLKPHVVYKKWTVKLYPPSCATGGAPKLELIGPAPGGSGAPPVFCLVYNGCSDTGAQFIGGGPDMCGHAVTCEGAKIPFPCNNGAFFVNISCGCGSGTVTACSIPVPKTICIVFSSTDIPAWNGITCCLQYSEDTFWQWSGLIFASNGTCAAPFFIDLTTTCPTFHLDITGFSAGVCSPDEGGVNFTPSDPFAASGSFDLKNHTSTVTYGTISFIMSACEDVCPAPCCAAELEDRPDLCLLVPGGYTGSGSDVVIDMAFVGSVFGVWSGSLIDNPFAMSTATIFVCCVNGVWYASAADEHCSGCFTAASSHSCNPVDVVWPHSALTGFGGGDCILTLCA